MQNDQKKQEIDHVPMADLFPSPSPRNQTPHNSLPNSNYNRSAVFKSTDSESRRESHFSAT